MLFLTDTNDKLEIVRSSAAAIATHVSGIDTLAAVSASPPQVKENHNYSTAATGDILAAPAGSNIRTVMYAAIRNGDAALSCDVTVNYNDNGTAYPIFKTTLNPGDVAQYLPATGWFVTRTTALPLKNFSTAAQGAGFAADTYLTGSNIAIPATGLAAGSTYRLWFEVTKTAAGVATPIITIRYGTAATTADASRAALTFGAGTAAIDTGLFICQATFRTVGSGTSAVIAAHGGVARGTGVVGSTLVGGAVNVGGGFDSTVANSIIGASFNGGTSFSGTVQLVRAELLL